MSTSLAAVRGQPARDVGDPHRLAHVEDEHLAAAADDGGLQDELHRLVGGHEVAGHLRMRHRQRAARGDLRGQRGEDRPAAAEDVAEADAQVAPAGLARHDAR